MSAINAMALRRPCRKRHTTVGPNDRISELPDGLIGHILSRLPTEDATKTSILSRTWKYKWTSICDFDIDDGRRNSGMESFINFVNRILFRTCDSKIRSFSLSCKEKYDPGYIETWISRVLMRNVEILVLRVWNVKLDCQWCFENWTSLTELDLCMDCTLVLPADNLFPNLKRLVLGPEHADLLIKPEQSSRGGGIILHFPVLEYIHLGCEWLDVNFVEIHAPELITFENFYEYEINPTCEIKVFGAAKLAKFISTVTISYELHGCPSVSSAEVLEFGEPFDYKAFLRRAHKTLKQLPNLEYLSLPGELVEFLLQPDSGFVFPKFGRLRKLHLRYCCKIKDVVKLLQLIPQVEMLDIRSIAQEESNEETGKPWPLNIVSNLKTLRLEDFCGHRLQFDFLMFVMNNAKNLQKMSLVVDHAAPPVLKAFMNLMSLRNSTCDMEFLSE